MRHYITAPNGAVVYEGSKEIIARHDMSSLDSGVGQIRFDVKQWVGQGNDEKYDSYITLSMKNNVSGKVYRKTFVSAINCTATVPAGSYEVAVWDLSGEHHAEKFLDLQIIARQECVLLFRLGWSQIE